MLVFFKLLCYNLKMTVTRYSVKVPVKVIHVAEVIEGGKPTYEFTGGKIREEHGKAYN